MPKDLTPAGVRKDVSKDDVYYSNARPEIVSRISNNPNMVLDVGCGNGMLGLSIKAKYPSCKVVGIEYADSAVKLASEKLDDVWKINLNELSSEDIIGEFDLIICADVIEHLLDPESCLQTLRSKMTTNGSIIISIPNIGHWSVLLPLLVDDRFTYTDQGLLDKTHVHLFTYTEMKLMLSRCNLQIVKTDINQLKGKPSPEVLDKLFDLVSSLGGNEKYAKCSMEAYQYIIEAKPVT